MKTRRLALCAALTAALLAGCEEKIDVPATDAATAAEAAQAPSPAVAGPAASATGAANPAAIEPVVVDANAVRVGSALDAAQAATGTRPAYAIGDTVYASLATGGRSGTAKVYWSGSDGISVKEEEKPVNGDNVNFRFSRADGMKPGKYTVEIDLDDVPAGITDFTVR